ncbi:MAG: hypothetical protein ABR607_11455 [Pyrinomonadaceae bacterium]
MYFFLSGELPAARGQRGRQSAIRTALLVAALAYCLIAPGFIVHTQAPQSARGVIRLKVRFKSGDVSKELARKRFFLIKGSLNDNKLLIEKIKQTEVMSRECYYRSKGASEALLKWLKESDCESLYCREIEEKYVAGNEAVPEFKAAYDQGIRNFKSAELARRWLTVNLPADLRDGYYNFKQQTINALIKQAEASSGKSVLSIMTDRRGTAYFTDIEPGVYTISNLIGSETDTRSILWTCEREVKATDIAIAMRRPFILSNEKDPKVKCEIVERPLAVCNH